MPYTRFRRLVSVFLHCIYLFIINLLQLRILYWLICLCGSGLITNSHAKDEFDPSIRTHNQELTDIEKQAEAISAELIEHEAERTALMTELQAREKAVAELSLSTHDLERDIKEKTRTANELKARQVEEQVALEKEREQLTELLRTAYVMGRADRLRLLLNQEDPAQASRMLSYFAYFNRERVRRILSVKERAERIANLVHETEAELARLAELMQSKAALRQQLEAAKEARALILKQLEARIASRAENLQMLRKDANSLRRLVEHLRQRAEIRAELDVQRPPFRERQGKLSWPLLEGRVTVNFGAPKAQHSELRWDGVLLEAQEGEAVRAVNDGRVVYADWLRGFGLLLILDHGDGFMTLYGNNQALLRELGEWVATGEDIALSGNSGGRDKSMLYFAIRHHGQPLDPSLWCRRASQAAHAALHLDTNQIDNSISIH
ncbi:peptidase M23 [Chromatium weissei]|nr:peptidase M23 [Chromatium weissei]